MKNKIPIILKYTYVSTMIIFSIGAGIFLTKLLIGVVVHPDSHGKKSGISEDLQQKIFQASEEVVRHMGDMGFSEPRLEGHFHHIGKWYKEDKWNFCIECHGSIPHSKSLEKRSFLNMHTLFISCQVCHVSIKKSELPDGENRYGWIDIEKGKLQPNPDMENAEAGDYGVKIIQLSGTQTNLTPFYMEKERKLYKEIKSREKELNETQKGITNKLLHKRCSEKPIGCEKCHTSENPLLSFDELGYSEVRQEFLLNPEVVDLVKRPEEFHIPSLLNGENSDSTVGDDSQ